MDLVSKNVKAPKSMAKVCILQILNSTTCETPLTQDAIRALLKDDYGISIDRKTLKKHLSELVESIDCIRYSVETRMVKGEESEMLSHFWIEKEDAFEESQLRALIYSVIFSKHIPTKTKEEMVRKLESLSSSDIRRKMKSYILEDASTADDSNELFWNIEEISRAIDERRRINFRYKRYAANLELVISEATFTVSPLGISMRDDNYFLAGTVNGVQSTSGGHMTTHLGAVVEAMKHREVLVNVFRMDRISGVQVLDEERESLDSPNSLKLKGAHDNKLDMQEYSRQNPAMKTGYAVLVKFKLIPNWRCTLTEVVDYFGKGNIHVRLEQEGSINQPAIYSGSVRVNYESMRDFALRNTPCIEVVEPAELRDDLEKAYQAIAEQYAKQ